MCYAWGVRVVIRGLFCFSHTRAMHPHVGERVDEPMESRRRCNHDDHTTPAFCRIGRWFTSDVEGSVERAGPHAHGHGTLQVTGWELGGRGTSRAMTHEWRSVRFRLLVCTHDSPSRGPSAPIYTYDAHPCGAPVRADKLTEPRKRFDVKTRQRNQGNV